MQEAIRGFKGIYRGVINMKDKNLVTKIILILAVVIIVILVILLVKYISLYKEVSNLKFGYYIDSNMQITNRDLQNHNRIYEQFCVGKYDYNYVIKLIDYIYNSNHHFYLLSLLQFLSILIYVLQNLYKYLRYYT